MIVAGLMRVKTDWQMLAMSRHVRQQLIFSTGRFSEELADHVSEVSAPRMATFVEEHGADRGKRHGGTIPSTW